VNDGFPSSSPQGGLPSPEGAHAVAIGTALGSFPFTLPDGTCDRDNAGSYASSAKRLIVRSCSITTGRPVWRCFFEARA
jgi:hypothetical protein